MPRSRQGKILALDWDSHTLRIVHAVLQKRGVQIDRILSVAVPAEVDSMDPDAMGAHIRRALDQEGISTRSAVVDVPRDQAFLKSLALPVAKPEDLPGMVAIQIAKELPFASSEASIDFAVGHQDDGSSTADVIVAAIKHETLDYFKSTVHAAGLRLERVGLRPYASTIAVNRQLQFSEPERVMFVDVRPTLTEIDVIRGRCLAFSRAAEVMVFDRGGSAGADERSGEQGAPLRLSRDSSEEGASKPSGSPDMIRRESSSPARRGHLGVINELMMEVTRSIEAYRSGDAGARIDQIVVGGDLGVEADLASTLHSRLEIPAELYNPATAFGWEPDEGAAASGYAATLGLVLGESDGDEEHFDFLHPKRTVSTTTRRLKKAPLVAAVVALFAVAGIGGFARATKPDRMKLKQIKSDIEAIRDEERDYKKFLAIVEEVEAFDAGQYVWPDVLLNIVSVLPSHRDLVIESLELRQDDGEVKMKTRAKQREIATQVVQQLEAFRRPDCKKPRFDASFGPQTEKRGELYPFSQDFEVIVLDDDAGPSGTCSGD